MCFSSNISKPSRRGYFAEELGVMHGDASKNASTVQADFHASTKNTSTTPATPKSETRTHVNSGPWQQLELF